MSSELSAERVVATYAFEQLEATATGPVGARDILSEALAQAARIREQARAEGEAEGRAAGIAAGQAEVHDAVAALAAALGEVQELRRQLVTALEHDAVELAFDLAEQVLGGALDARPERVVDVARNALRRVVDRRRVTLVVNPADLEILSDAVARLQSELGGIEHCDVQSDRRIARGGAVMRTDAGEIDVTLASQLERAREIVATALREPDDR